MLVCRVIKVPVGTFISTLSQSDAKESIADAIGNSPRRCTDPEAFDRQHDGDAFKEANAVTADLDTPATRIVVARGGAGGRGSVSKGRADDDEGWCAVQFTGVLLHVDCQVCSNSILTMTHHLICRAGFTSSMVNQVKRCCCN